jgi:hypothetical protein
MTASTAGWVFSRARVNNHSILGDKYLPSIKPNHAAPWGSSLSGDFSNQVFNLVYHATNLCGDGYILCKLN